MVTITIDTAHVGQHVRVRIGRHWHAATIEQLGAAYGGAPCALVRLDNARLGVRHELLSKLRPAASQSLFPPSALRAFNNRHED